MSTAVSDSSAKLTATIDRWFLPIDCLFPYLETDLLLLAIAGLGGDTRLRASDTDLFSCLRPVPSADQPTQTLCTIHASFTGLPKRSATVCLDAGDAIGCA